MRHRHGSSGADSGWPIVLVLMLLTTNGLADVVARPSGGGVVGGGAFSERAGSQPVGTFYVSPTGRDDNSGRSPSHPFRTLERAQSAMQALGTRASTTYLMGGLYSRTQILDLTHHADQNKAWVSYPGQLPILDGGGKIAQGIKITESGVTVKGITLQNFSNSGLYAKYCDDLLIDGNRILNTTTPDWRTDVLGSGIFLLRVRRSLITRNHIDGNTATGIQISSGGPEDDNSDDVVSHNEVYNTCSAVNDCGAIYVRDLGHSSRRQRIDHNVIGNFGRQSSEDVGIYLDDESSGLIVSDNVVFGAGTYALVIHGGDHNVIRNNIFDVSHLTKLGLYQDDVGAGGPNYGMAGNRFTRNIVYSLSPWPKPLWDYINQSGTVMGLLEVADNLYHGPELSGRDEGTIVDSRPFYADPRFVDPATHNYHLLPGSPAVALGFGQ